MIPKYIQDWFDIINQMSNSTTYKLAWGKAIIECIYLEKYNDNGDDIIVDERDLANAFLKYYWNQIYFFKLRQSPRNALKSVIENIVEDLIKEYEEVTGLNYPVWFDKAETILINNCNFNKVLKRVVTAMNYDVAWRFKKASSIREIYILDKKNRCLKFSKQSIVLLKEYGHILVQLLNYRWAQLLEVYNTHPRITNKVRGSSEDAIRRKSLKKFERLLIENSDEVLDFYTGNVLSKNEISVDHVIPWSFMYDDNIWNLVLTSKSKNSSKNNRKPTNEEIEMLILRNKKLVNKLDKESKYYMELKDSLDNNIVRKYYINMM